VSAPKPLVVRAGLSRTFGSIAGVAALGLLSMGVYLLSDAFAHPVNAEAAGVILAACVIAMAMLLFVFIFKPWRFREILRRKESARTEQERLDFRAKEFNALLWTGPPSGHERLLRLRRAESRGNSSLPESYDGESDVPQ